MNVEDSSSQQSETEVEDTLVPLSELDDYIILTEDELRELLTKAANESTSEAVQIAVASERERFAKIELETRTELINTQIELSKYKGATLGLGVTLGISVTGLVAIMFLQR